MQSQNSGSIWPTFNQSVANANIQLEFQIMSPISRIPRHFLILLQGTLHKAQLRFCWAARFMIPSILNILPSMALTVPKKVTSGNTWAQRFSPLSRFHLHAVPGTVLGLLDPCGGRRYTPIKHDQQAQYSAVKRPKTSHSKQWRSPTLYHWII